MGGGPPAKALAVKTVDRINPAVQAFPFIGCTPVKGLKETLSEGLEDLFLVVEESREVNISTHVKKVVSSQ
jgi:hypothetical protein